MIEIVSATRLSETEFWQRSALGESLQRLTYDSTLSSHLTFENRTGLPEIYNSRIQASSADILVFMHDDVWIDELLFTQALLAGLKVYDIVGVAGNRRRMAKQPSWYYLDTKNKIKDEAKFLSGAMTHLLESQSVFSNYGPSPASCELLDGVFLAADRQTLLKAQIQFDPAFEFHFYDLDFCRRARQAGLDLGTWPIALTHQSGGAFGTEQWSQKYKTYLEKWGD